MSSGEVLFILAFIVLPTAILVSSVWAIIFVRSRPHPLRGQAYDEAEPTRTERDFASEETAVLPITPIRAADSDTDEPDVEELPVTEHDVIVITDEVETQEPAAYDDDERPEAAGIEPDVDEPLTANSDLDPIESPVQQSTEDLEDVVTTLRDMDQDTEEEDEGDTEPDSEPAAEQAVEDEPAQEVFSDTSELPTVEPSREPEPAADIPEPEPEDQAAEQAETGSRWRRRKQSVKLRPSDAEAPRARGRGRDQQRQVPQLNRQARRRDDASQSPPDPEDNPDSASTPPN